MCTYGRPIRRQRLRRRLQNWPNPLSGLIYCRRPRHPETGRTAAYHVGTRRRLFSCYFYRYYYYLMAHLHKACRRKYWSKENVVDATPFRSVIVVFWKKTASHPPPPLKSCGEALEHDGYFPGLPCLSVDKVKFRWSKALYLNGAGVGDGHEPAHGSLGASQDDGRDTQDLRELWDQHGKLQRKNPGWWKLATQSRERRAARVEYFIRLPRGQLLTG